MGWSPLPSLLASLILFGLCIHLYLRRPPEPLWPVAIVCQVFALLWAVGDAATYFATDLAQESRALTVLYTGSIGSAATWWILAVRYARANALVPAWLRGRAVEIAPAAVAVGLWLTFATNPWHGAFVTPVVGGPNLRHAGFWGTLVFSYAEVTGASALFAWVARRTSPTERRNALLLALATAAPLLTIAAYVSPAPPRTDLTGLALCITSASVLFGVRRMGLFRLRPVELAEVIRHDPHAILLVAPDGRLFFWNPAAEQLLAGVGLAPDLDLWPRLAETLVCEDGAPVADPARFAEELLRAKPEGHRSVFAFALGTPQGRWLRLSASPVPSRGGAPAALALRVEDVSPLRRAEQERLELEAAVRHTEKLKSLGLLAGGVAHGFNNLLTSILGNTALGLRALRPGMSPRHHFEEIQLAARQAADLTHQLLAYAGRAPRRAERVSLSRLIQDMERLVELSAGRDARVGLDLDPALAAVEGDPGQLGQVVMNLVANAGEAGAGVVSVSTRPAALGSAPDGSGAERDGVLLEVADDGRGMDAATRSRIFDPFFTTRADGRGLGLAVVHGIVSSHGGAIDVESEPQGGTRVRVWLPAARGTAVEREARRNLAGPARAGRWVGSGTVLVAEDQPSLLRIVRSVLASLGFDVVTAGGGLEALDRFRSLVGQVRLVVLDLTMPDLNGEEVLREIRELDPEVPVIVTTGHAGREVRDWLGGAKHLLLLQKPYELRELVGAVRRMVAGRE